MKSFFPDKKYRFTEKDCLYSLILLKNLYFRQVLQIFLEQSGLIKKADIVGINYYLPKFCPILLLSICSVTKWHN